MICIDKIVCIYRLHSHIALFRDQVKYIFMSSSMIATSLESRGDGGTSTKKKMSQKRCFFVYLGSYGDGKRWNALGLGQNGILVP